MALRGLHAQLPVSVTGAQHCFVRVPAALTARLQQAAAAGGGQGVLALRLGWLGPPAPESGGLARPCQAFVGWKDGPPAARHALELSSALADALGISEALRAAGSASSQGAMTQQQQLVVSVSLVPYAPVAGKVEVDPASADDWEVLQLHAHFVEEELLAQICVLGPGQKFPVFVHGTKIELKVANLELVDKGEALCAKLARDTEVAVAPKLRHSGQSFDPEARDRSRNELGKEACAVRVRVQSPPLQSSSDSGSNGIAWINASMIERLQKVGRWPAIRCNESGDVLFAEEKDGPSALVIAVICNRRRPEILRKLRTGKFSPSNKGMVASAIHQSYVRLRVSPSVAPGHVMIPSTVQVRSRLQPLDAVILSLPHFDPIPCPTSFPALRVKLTLLQGYESANDVHPGPEFRKDVVVAAQKWQKSRLFDPNDSKTTHLRLEQSDSWEVVHGVPVFDGALWCLQVSPERTVYFIVQVGGNESKTNIEGKMASREEKYFLLSRESKVEWQISKFVVNHKLQKILIADDAKSERKENDTVDPFDSMTSTADEEVVGETPLQRMQRHLARFGIEGYHQDYLRITPLSALGGIEKYMEKMFARLRPVLSRPEAQQRMAVGGPHPGGVYLCGGRGCGKTTLVKAVARELFEDPKSLVHHIYIPCANLRGGKRSEIEWRIGSAFSEALRMGPSLLIFDDMDLLLPAPSAGGDAAASGGEDAQMVWLAEWIEDLCTQYQRKLEIFERAEQEDQGSRPSARNITHRAVSWIATGREKRSLRASLLRPGLFDHTVEIQPLTTHQREIVLEALLKNKGCKVSDGGDKPDLGEIGARAEGYAPADLDTLVERAMHTSLLRLVEQSLSGKVPVPSHGPTITSVDFEAALEGFTPASLRGVALAKSDVKWSDVGGLKKIRDTLKETLELPIQFAPLYEHSPQRLASGVLLYGPPGCGKTLLAGAVAKECGLNFISVKGPELLGKYIGASEQAVRDLFARGAAAAPCIVFFDEFDAVAPRRGNDSTGVTDRVVNQLLTFLDGVESRSGVYIMAATSRPDLVDPALLRPGRLDKQLLCGFPTEDERLDILQTIARKMPMTKLAEEFLAEIASSPEAELFTGADLQAILYSAQLEVIHAGIDEIGDSDEPTSLLLIEPKHLRKAVREARPSVSREDRMRFNRIYEAFQGGRSADFNAVSGYPDGKQRTALV